MQYTFVTTLFPVNFEGTLYISVDKESFDRITVTSLAGLSKNIFIKHCKHWDLNLEPLDNEAYVFHAIIS